MFGVSHLDTYKKYPYCVCVRVCMCVSLCVCCLLSSFFLECVCLKSYYCYYLIIFELVALACFNVFCFYFSLLFFSSHFRDWWAWPFCFRIVIYPISLDDQSLECEASYWYMVRSQMGLWNLLYRAVHHRWTVRFVFHSNFARHLL